MIQRIKQEEALKLVLGSKTNICIIWVNDGGLTCSLLLENIENIRGSLPHWDFYVIERNISIDTIIFEPEEYPTSYIFKEGSRHSIFKGIAPEKVLLDTFRNIERGYVDLRD